MLGQRRRRHPNITPTLNQHFLFSGRVVHREVGQNKWNRSNSGKYDFAHLKYTSAFSRRSVGEAFGFLKEPVLRQLRARIYH